MTKAVTELKKHNISLFTAFMLIFAMVCAGCYGIEDMVSSSGPGLTLILLIVLPFFWSIPQGLIAAELGSAIPEEGGFYIWVQRAMGEFWGFLAGWYHTLSIYVDSTLYVVLSAAYLNSFFDLSDGQLFLFKAFFILVFTWVNIRGLTDVGRVASFLSIIVIVAFVILTVLGFAQWQHNPFVPLHPPDQTIWQSIGLGFAICMWTYSGYENLSPMAGEMKNPQIIPKAILLSMPIIMLFFILPTMAGLAAVGDWQNWGTEGANVITFANIAAALGYPVFTIVFVFAAFASNLSLYNTGLATGSRGFFIMADDHLAPPVLAKLHKKYKTPHFAIITMAVVNLFLCQYGFEVLVVIDVFLIMTACALTYFSIIILRKREPDLPRPFKIPLSVRGLTLLVIPPTLISIIALFTNGFSYYVGGIIGVVSGPLVYWLFKLRYGGLNRTKIVAPRDRKAALGIVLVAAFMLLGGLGYRFL